jgi:hypothetical protein
MKKITSIPGLFGTIIHYNEKGQKVGSSVKGSFKTGHYDVKGRKVGSTYSGRLKSDHYDTSGRKVGSSYHGAITTDHYSGNRKVGKSHKGFGRTVESFFCKD